ncbi:MAG TPA: helix-turn-helix domain-containing protein [Candidatus Tectomicrobia bacterium]|nr:helix-turn-helix domain-containing protein [Candidatus Tectomicrobia bacterium]
MTDPQTALPAASANVETAATERARPLRADALRNRVALLEAARAVFRRDGPAAQMEAIAAEAGLGVGTLYRNFPTKEALIAVLVEERLGQLRTTAEAATRTDDPWDGVARLVWELATFEAEDRGIADILAGSATQPEGADAAMTAFMGSLQAVVTRAQTRGTMRSDVSAEDVVTAVCGVGKMMAPAAAGGDERWRRLIRVILDGLRAPAAQASGDPS